MVKNAGISKGALFLYFKNKETLYNYVLEYAHNLYMEMVVNKCLDLSEKDLFNRLSNYMRAKFEIVLEYPYIQKLFETLQKENPTYISNLIKENTDTVFKYFSEGLDKSNLRDDIPFDKMSSIIIYTFESLGNSIIKESEIMGKEVDYEKAFKHAEEYIECFKTLFSKN